MKEQIIRYLKEKYHPVSILVLGSYADGTFDETSDFDAIVIVDIKHDSKDISEVKGIPLDVDIYTVDEVMFGHPKQFIKAHDAEIVLDTEIGRLMKERVIRYFEEIRVTSETDKKGMKDWLRKMTIRIEKGDDDANYRMAMLMWESLAIYFLLRDLNFYGSKKSIRYLKDEDEAGYAVFHEAVTKKDVESLKNWVEYVKNY